MAQCGSDSHLPRSLCGRMETERSPAVSHFRARMAPWRCPPAIWAQSTHPAQGHNWTLTTMVVWRSLGQNDFLCTSLCRHAPCRTATLVRYQLWANLEPKCEMEKRSPVVPETAHRSFLFHQGFEPNPVSATPPTKDNAVSEFRL